MINNSDSILERIDSKYLWKETSLFNEIKCLVCKSIAFNPKICQNCEKIYCQVCSKINTTGGLCNFCENSLILKDIKTSYLDNFSNIDLRCINKDLGCPYIISYKSYLSHSQNCLYKRHFCIGRDCNYESTFKNVEIHILSCCFVEIKCLKCNLDIRRLDMDDHLRNCEKNFVFCPYCKRDYKKRYFLDINYHLCYDKFFEQNNFKIINKKHEEQERNSDLLGLKFKLFSNLKKIKKSNEFLRKKRKVLFRRKYNKKIKRKIMERQEKSKEETKELEEESKESSREILEKISFYRTMLTNMISKNQGIFINKRKINKC